MFFDDAKITKSLVIDAKNKTKSNQFGKELTFEVPLIAFLAQKYNKFGTDSGVDALHQITSSTFIIDECEFGREFRIFSTLNDGVIANR